MCCPEGGGLNDYSFAGTRTKGPDTTTWIWNLHADAHDFDSHTSDLEEISRKVFSAHFGQLSIIFLWLSGMYFHGARFSNYEAWLSDPTPLGVPSRMNVGQIFECSLGLAGDMLDRHYRIAPFDERYEQEASRKLVFSELYEASKQTSNPWIFEPEYPGKSRIFDGRTGNPFEQPVIIGKPYILKLIHQVDDKIHGRSCGHYALVTQQPLRGRAKQGGQRVGEMEVWALEGFGVAHILQEMLTYKSDHIKARQIVLATTIIGRTIPKPANAPESFRLLVRELRSLAMELNHFLVSEKNFRIHRKEA
ncbi:hypothetical protein AHAS_Ahas09G0063300 [Arachis hypogaea]